MSAVLILLVAGGFGVYYLLPELRQGGVELSDSVLAPGVDVELHDVSFSEVRSGTLKYRLKADSALYRAGGVSQVRGITLRFFSQDGMETMVVRAREGDVAGANQLITLRGSVEATSPQGYLLETDYLTYDKSDDKITTDAVIKLTSHSGVLTGRGLLAYPQRERLKILHDVQGTIVQTPSVGVQRSPRGDL